MTGEVVIDLVGLQTLLDTLRGRGFTCSDRTTFLLKMRAAQGPKTREIPPEDLDPPPPLPRRQGRVLWRMVITDMSRKARREQVERRWSQRIEQCHCVGIELFRRENIDGS